jgi:hypothetical protein
MGNATNFCGRFDGLSAPFAQEFSGIVGSWVAGVKRWFRPVKYTFGPCQRPFSPFKLWCFLLGAVRFDMRVQLPIARCWAGRAGISPNAVMGDPFRPMQRTNETGPTQMLTVTSLRRILAHHGQPEEPGTFPIAVRPLRATEHTAQPTAFLRNAWLSQGRLLVGWTYPLAPTLSDRLYHSLRRPRPGG